MKYPNNWAKFYPNKSLFGFKNYLWLLISIKHISVFGLLIMVYSLTTLIPAAIISTLENRDFFESWYFATTTISTVGFGDFKLR